MTTPSSPRLPIVAFVDLDDTLFRSAKKVWRDPPFSQVPESPPTEPNPPHRLGRPVTVKRDGTPYSYMATWQTRFFDGLLAHCDRIIPTTARTVDAFNRVDLPFSDLVICAEGGVVLQADRRIDPEWDAFVAQTMAGLSQSPQDLASQINALDPALDARLVEDAGRTLHLSVRHRERESQALLDFGARFAPDCPTDWVVLPHHFDVVVRPRALGKAAAVTWVQQHRLDGPALTLGVGDRDSDLEFMSCCHYAITPTTSQIFEACMETQR